MISDTLFEAIAEIEEYEAKCAEGEGYRSPRWKAKIAAVKDAMRTLQEELDTSPYDRRPELLRRSTEH